MIIYSKFQLHAVLVVSEEMWKMLKLMTDRQLDDKQCAKTKLIHFLSGELKLKGQRCTENEWDVGQNVIL